MSEEENAHFRMVRNATPVPFGDERHTMAREEVAINSIEYCVECSNAARNWVSWPCSRAKLVEAAVEIALHLERMDSAEARIDSYGTGFRDGLKAAERSRKGLFGWFRG